MAKKNVSQARSREEAYNTELARLISEENSEIVSTPEDPVSGGSVDVIVEWQGERIAIEAKKLNGSSEGYIEQKIKAAAGQARKRIKDNDAGFGVVVLYPPKIEVRELKACSSLIWTHVKLDGNEEMDRASHSTGSASELAEWLPWVTAEKDPTKMTNLLKSTLRHSAADLTEADRQRLLKEFNLPPNLDIPGTIRVLLTVAAAVMFHSRLQAHLEGLPKVEYPKDDSTKSPIKWVPPSSPAKSLDSSSPISELSASWELILRVDYKPIFDAARVALQALEGQNSAVNPIKRIGRAALKVAEEVPHLRHDLMGSIFHEVLDTARYDGSFYTTTAAATLLAGLSISEGDRDWSDPDKAADLRICDPACGSGTLLMAAAERVYQLRRNALGVSDSSSDSDINMLLSKEMLENCLWGYDINRTAIHLAATTLALLSPAIDFKSMSLFESKFCVDKKHVKPTVYLGSIDLLRKDPGKFALNESPGQNRQVELDYNDPQAHEEELKAATPPEMDLVIMNPPFTRTDIRHDQFKKDEEKMIKEAEISLMNDWKERQRQQEGNNLFEGRNSFPLYGSSTLFLALGESLTKNSSGGGGGGGGYQQYYQPPW